MGVVVHITGEFKIYDKTMAVGTGAAAAYGIISTGLDRLGVNLGGLFGSSEKGTGTTQRGTLPHAIDKYEKANDFEAIEAAKVAIQMGLQGKSESEIEAVMAQSLGYSPGDMIDSHKWDYVSETLNDAIAQAQNASNEGASNPAAMVPGLGGATQAGIGWPMIVAIVGIVGSVLYYKYQP